MASTVKHFILIFAINIALRGEALGLAIDTYRPNGLISYHDEMIDKQYRLRLIVPNHDEQEFTLPLQRNYATPPPLPKPVTKKTKSKGKQQGSRRVRRQALVKISGADDGLGSAMSLTRPRSPLNVNGDGANPITTNTEGNKRKRRQFVDTMNWMLGSTSRYRDRRSSSEAEISSNNNKPTEKPTEKPMVVNNNEEELKKIFQFIRNLPIFLTIPGAYISLTPQDNDGIYE